MFNPTFLLAVVILWFKESSSLPKKKNFNKFLPLDVRCCFFFFLAQTRKYIKQLVVYLELYKPGYDKILTQKSALKRLG